MLLIVEEQSKTFILMETGGCLERPVVYASALSFTDFLIWPCICLPACHLFVASLPACKLIYAQ